MKVQKAKTNSTSHMFCTVVVSGSAAKISRMIIAYNSMF